MTTFHFVADGIDAALKQAQAVASGLDIRVGGGPPTIRQYLSAGLMDEMHVAPRLVLLGCGEPLLVDVDLRTLGYECMRNVMGERLLHFFIGRRRQIEASCAEWAPASKYGR